MHLSIYILTALFESNQTLQIVIQGWKTEPFRKTDTRIEEDRVLQTRTQLHKLKVPCLDIPSIKLARPRAIHVHPIPPEQSTLETPLLRHQVEDDALTTHELQKHLPLSNFESAKEDPQCKTKH